MAACPGLSADIPAARRIAFIVYKHFLKPLLFRLSPETAHHLTLLALKFVLAIPGLGRLLHSHYQVKSASLERRLMGLVFPNPVGLAAGFDKDGRHFRAMAALGFGFVELGTVTPREQAGNPRPRLFRLAKDKALINRMGFNNEGATALAQRLRRRPAGLIVGGNIGKNKDTPNERAIDDYLYCFEQLFPYVDYFSVNVSSPNTPGLRQLQDRAFLAELLEQVQALNRKKQAPKPLLLKIAPDLNETQLDDILDIVRQCGLAGIIATNTTVDRANLSENADRVAAIGPGGLSGRPLRARATEVIRYLRRRAAADLVIIGVGGIASPADAREKIEAGADLIQVYTGLVFEGPALVKKINLALRNV
jgi:dihydroorotate dehydrogenase